MTLATVSPLQNTTESRLSRGATLRPSYIPLPLRRSSSWGSCLFSLSFSLSSLWLDWYQRFLVSIRSLIFDARPYIENPSQFGQPIPLCLTISLIVRSSAVLEAFLAFCRASSLSLMALAVVSFSWEFSEASCFICLSFEDCPKRPRADSLTALPSLSLSLSFLSSWFSPAAGCSDPRAAGYPSPAAHLSWQDPDDV